MARNVRCGLIQVRCEWSPEKLSLGEIKEKKGAYPGPAGNLLRSLFLCRTADALVRADRARAQRTYDLADAETGEKAPDGAGRADLRSGNDRGVLQHRSGDRRGRPLSREISQAPYPALPSGILGEILFHTGKCRVSGLRDALRARRRV